MTVNTGFLKTSIKPGDRALTLQDYKNVIAASSGRSSGMLLLTGFNSALVKSLANFHSLISELNSDSVVGTCPRFSQI